MKKGLWIAVVFVILFNCLGLVANAQGLNSDEVYDETDNNRTVNVGFFYSEGYHEKDEYGNLSGYGYELIERMKQFTGWNVNYVGYDKTWLEMLDMLNNGEIDILTDVNYSNERAKEFLFSEYDIGASSFVITKRPDDNRYETDELRTLNGARIGVLEGSIAADRIREYARNKFWNYKLVYFPNEEELKKALLVYRSIDLILSTNLRNSTDEEIVCSFGDEYTYIITAYDNYELMSEVDYSLSTIKMLDPFYFNNLTKKYFSDTSVYSNTLSLNERKYIENNKDRVYKAYISTSLFPLSYNKENEVTGIVPEYFEYLSDNVNINVEFVNSIESADPVEALKNHEIDIWVDSVSDYNFANNFNVRISVPVIEFSMGILHQSDSYEEFSRLGAIFAIKTAFTDMDQVYTSLDEGINCLSNGEVDGIVVPVYTAQHIKELYGDLFDFVPFDEKQKSGMSLAFSPDSDILLSSIYSKAILNTPDTVISELVSKHLERKSDIWTYKNLYEKMPWIPWAFAILVMSIVSLIVILLYKSGVSKREHELSLDNLSYFKSVISGNRFAIKMEFDKNGKNSYVYFADDSYEGGIKEVAIEDSIILENRNRVHPEDQAIFDEFLSDEFLRNLIVTKGTYYTELRSLNSKGFYGFYSVSIDIMPKLGNVDRVLILIKDITMIKMEEEEKRNTLTVALENAQKYSDSKTFFLSQMSHDIRTPLNAIMGMTSLAAMNIDKKEKVLEYLSIVHDSSSHLLSLVNDILDTSKIEKGQLKFSFANMSILDVFDKAVIMHSERIANNEIVLNVSREVYNPIVYCDENRLLRAFSNIISNAVKYTKKGGSINISLTENGPRFDGSRFFEFVVQDNGIGMDEETLATIFEPFSRAKEAEFTEGSGLGMSITKSIIDTLGGVIKVESEVNVGTTVTVTLGFNETKTGEVSSEKEKEEPKEIKKTVEGKRVLLVEDVEINAMFAEALCEMKGLICDIAVNGEEAVKKLEQSEDGYYSIVLMDIQMPVMNGYDATRKIRSYRRKYLKKIPIIAMSANAFEEDIIKCKDAGMDDHLAKPVDIHRFSDIVDKFVV